jgi:hypothetical protein
VPKSWHEESEREKLKLEKLKLEEPKRKVPLEPPTIISKEELNRQAVIAGTSHIRGNRAQLQWGDRPEPEQVKSPESEPVSGGNNLLGHTTSVGGLTSNLGEGNRWVRPHTRIRDE